MAELIEDCFIALARFAEDPQQRIVFSYMPEGGFSDTKSANYEDILILGRQEPIRSYSSSSARAINFGLDFFATDDVLSDVLHRVEWLRSLVYPDVTDGPYSTMISKLPPVILLSVGLLYRMRAIVKSVNVTWMEPWGVPAEGYSTEMTLPPLAGGVIAPMHAKVDMSIEEIDNLLAGGNPMRKMGIQNWPPAANVPPPKGSVPRKVAPVGGLPSFIPNPSEFVEKIGIPGFLAPHGNIGGPFGI